MKLKPYKGFEGAVTYVDPEANTLTAEVVNCEAGIHAQASTPAELQREWEASVDVYLTYCAERGIEPLKPFSGVMSLRLGPELHREAHRAARLEGKSLNAWIKDEIARAVGYTEDVSAHVRAVAERTPAAVARPRKAARK